MVNNFKKYFSILILFFLSTNINKVQYLIPPHVDIIIITYYSLHSSRLSPLFLFILGIMSDILHVEILGINSIIYLSTYIYSHHYSSGLLHINIIVRACYFTLLLILVNATYYFLSIIDLLPIINLTTVLKKLGLSIICYLVVVKGISKKQQLR